jgi:uncharacterized protein YbcI
VRRAWGRGPVKTSAHLAGPNVLVVLLQDGHTYQEQALHAAGHNQELIDGRRLLHEILVDDLKAIVEQALGREVATVLSATRVDPALTAEVFVLTDGNGAQSQCSRDARAANRDDARAGQASARELRARAAQVRSESRRFFPDEDHGR